MEDGGVRRWRRGLGPESVAKGCHRTRNKEEKHRAGAIMYFVSITKPSLISHFTGSHTEMEKQKEAPLGVGKSRERSGTV